MTRAHDDDLSCGAKRDPALIWNCTRQRHVCVCKRETGDDMPMQQQWIFWQDLQWKCKWDDDEEDIDYICMVRVRYVDSGCHSKKTAYGMMWCDEMVLRWVTNVASSNQIKKINFNQSCAKWKSIQSLKRAARIRGPRCPSWRIDGQKNLTICQSLPLSLSRQWNRTHQNQ